jgi:hypothetical protein
MLKIWNVNRLAKEMPSSLLTEWVAFITLENEEMDKSMKEHQLIQEASQGIKQMRTKRGRK